MSQSADHYPIVQFINGILSDSGFSRSEFVASLGYRNLERGLLRLTPWLEKGEGYGLIIRQIAKRYPLRADEMQKAIALTEEIQAAENKADWIETLRSEGDSFKPYIHVEGEVTVPRGIFLFGLTGGDSNLIEVPGKVAKMALDAQIPALSSLMHGYLGTHKGNCPFFGKVTGFLYVRLLDCLQFSRKAEFIKVLDEPFRRGDCEVSL